MKKASREIPERTLDVDDGNPQMSCRYRGGCLQVISKNDEVAPYRARGELRKLREQGIDCSG